jgi:hypothetical protein
LASGFSAWILSFWWHNPSFMSIRTNGSKIPLSIIMSSFGRSVGLIFLSIWLSYKQKYPPADEAAGGGLDRGVKPGREIPREPPYDGSGANRSPQRQMRDILSSVSSKNAKSVYLSLSVSVTGCRLAEFERSAPPSRQRSGSHEVYLDAINILIRPSRLISLDLLQI